MKHTRCHSFHAFCGPGFKRCRSEIQLAEFHNSGPDCPWSAYSGVMSEYVDVGKELRRSPDYLRSAAANRVWTDDCFQMFYERDLRAAAKVVFELYDANPAIRRLVGQRNK